MNKAVIGGGPAGCFYASQVSDVHIFEEHKEIGNPIACTGIITDSIHSVVKVKKSTLVSHISSFKITSPDGKSLSIPFKKKNPIFDRKLFDHHMLELAIDNGSKVHHVEKFL